MHSKQWMIIGAVSIVGLVFSGIARAEEYPPEGNAGAEAAEEPAREGQQLSIPGQGWLSLGTKFVSLNGDGESFREDQHMDDNFMYGLRGLDWSFQQDGTTAELTGRALHPDDYGVNLRLASPDIGWFEGYFDQFPSYWDTSNFFYNFAPFTTELDRDLIQRRREAGVESGFRIPHGPTVVLRAKHWQLDGNRSTFWGGGVEDGADLYFSPQFAEVDQERHTLGLDVLATAGRFDIETGVEFEDFEGRNKVVSRSFGAGGGLVDVATSNFDPEYTEIMPYFDLTGDVIEDVLRLEFHSHYRYTDTDGTYDEDTVDGAGAPTNAHHANNFINNEHHGDVNEVLGNTRLVYTPTDRTTLFGGLGFKAEDADHRSLQGYDGDHGAAGPAPDGVVDEKLFIDTDDDRRTWMGNIGGQHSIFPWLVARAEARYENNDLDRDWRENQIAPGPDSTDAFTSRYTTDADYCRTEYGASLTAKPLQSLKVVAKWDQERVDYDYDIKQDTVDGAAAPGEYPGFIRDNSRRTNEYALLTQYRPNRYWWASYKLSTRVTDFQVDKEPSEEISSEQDVINSFNLSFMPIEKLTVTASGAVQAMRVKTKASHATSARVSNFKGDMCTWGLHANHELTDRIGLLAGFRRTEANSIFDYQSTDVYAGLEYEVSDSWSVDFRYDFVTFDEHANGNIDDYDGHVFTVGMVGRWK